MNWLKRVYNIHYDSTETEPYGSVCNVHQNETKLDNIQENDIIWN